MKRLNLSFPELMFVAATRGALGAGVGMLLADKLRPRDRRRAIGWMLVAFGMLTTIPAAVFIRRAAAIESNAPPSAASPAHSSLALSR